MTPPHMSPLVRLENPEWEERVILASPKSTEFPVVSIFANVIVLTLDGASPPANNARVPPVCNSGDVASISHHCSPLYNSNLLESLLNLIQPEGIVVAIISNQSEICKHHKLELLQSRITLYHILKEALFGLGKNYRFHNFPNKFQLDFP